MARRNTNGTFHFKDDGGNQIPCKVILVKNRSDGANHIQVHTLAKSTFCYRGCFYKGVDEVSVKTSSFIDLKFDSKGHPILCEEEINVR